MKPVKSCFHPMLHKIIVTLSKCWFGVTVFYGRLNRKPPEIPVIRRVEIIISKPVGRPFCPCMLMFPVFFSRSVCTVKTCFGNMAPEKPKPPFPELQKISARILLKEGMMSYLKEVSQFRISLPSALAACLMMVGICF